MVIVHPVGCEQVAAYTLFVYDWLLTLDTERQMLSQPGLAPAKLAYIFCRYWPLIFQPLTLWVQVGISNIKESDCGNFKIPLYVTAINFAGSASVLLVRLHAFNGQKLWSTMSLAMAMVAIVIYTIHTGATRTKLAPFAPACFPTDSDPTTRWVSGIFLAPLLWDMSVTVVFIYYAVRSRISYSLSRGAIRVFVREGLMYFFAIATVHGINVILTWQSDITISGAFVPFSMLLPNVLACRLVINLRKAVSAEDSQLPQHTRSGTINISDLQGSVPSVMVIGPDAAQAHISPYYVPSAKGPAYVFTGPHARANSDSQLWFGGLESQPTTTVGTGSYGTSSYGDSGTGTTTDSSVQFRSIGSANTSSDGRSPSIGGQTPASRWWNLRFVTEKPQRDRVDEGSYTLSFQTRSSGSVGGMGTGTGTSSQGSVGGGGQVLLAPPLPDSRQISPRLKLFSTPAHASQHPDARSGAVSQRTSLYPPPAVPALRASGGTFGPDLTFSRPASSMPPPPALAAASHPYPEDGDMVTPTQHIPADVHSAGYMTSPGAGAFDSPLSPLRQRAPSDSARRAERWARERDREKEFTKSPLQSASYATGHSFGAGDGWRR
ncbi:hypothetical protein BKA62DRAFT_695724 [Auriculariales sp. MPI-PUGE-AT-0066]|nr:hypothetical protein BKA62DRAFT_695724 [Auriculariales sp. MPI-PUGE-AT-0066]